MEEMSKGDWEQHFDMFWSKWPDKKSKKPALASWMKITPKTKPQFQAIYLSVEAHLERSKKWQNGYIPMCTTWLNQERWLDDLGAPKIKTSANNVVVDSEAVFEAMGYEDRIQYEQVATNAVESSFIENASDWVRKSKTPMVEKYIKMMPESARDKLRALIRKGPDT